MDSVSPRITRRQFVASSSAALAAGSFVSQAFAASSPVAGQNQIAGRGPFRVVIDTDPGVDDALALLLAMRSPELKIEAITPVAGNVPLELTLPNALRIVEIAGRTDIPVAACAKAPLLRRLVSAAYAHGENGLGGAVFPEPKIKQVAEPAAEFIRHIVRKYPNEVTLITIGPLTNVATALNADPELAGMIKSLVMMGGIAFRGEHHACGGVQHLRRSGGSTHCVPIRHSHHHGRPRRYTQNRSDRNPRAEARIRPESRQPGGSEDCPQRYRAQSAAGVCCSSPHA